MADFLNYLFSAAAWWIWLALALALIALFYMRHDSFALTDFTYRIPLIGKLARFSKDYSETYRGNGWLNVEDTLCRDYARHVSALSERQFDNHIQYLRKSYDHGRKPLPMWALVTLILLVSMEGLGFSYLLGTLINPEGSENTQNLLMFGIVAVLAAVLVWVMHSAGHQLYRTNLLRSCFKEFQAHKDPSFTSHIVALAEPQTVDNKWPDGTPNVANGTPTPEHVRCANRVATKPGDRGNYAWVWLAALLMLVIAVASTVLRIEMMHGAQAAELSPSFAGMFQVGGGAPPAPAPAASNAAQEIAAMAGFTILAIIFVVTQLVGMSVGYRYGFAGKQSKEAYQATHGAADYDSYWAPVQRRMNIANLRLHTLHRLLEKHSPRPIEFKKTFIHFIKEEKRRGADNLQLPPGCQESARTGNGALDEEFDALASAAERDAAEPGANGGTQASQEPAA